MPIEIEASCYDELDLTDTDFMVSIRTGDGVKFTPREDKIDVNALANSRRTVTVSSASASSGKGLSDS